MGVAIINRSATRACRGFDPPRVVYEGSGQAGCELFKAAFAVAILAVVSIQFCLSVWDEKGKADDVGDFVVHVHHHGCYAACYSSKRTIEPC